MYLRIKALPNAKKETMKRLSETLFEVAVKEPAINNLANKRILVLIARLFEVTPSKARLVSGHHSRIKIINLDI